MPPQTNAEGNQKTANTERVFPNPGRDTTDRSRPSPQDKAKSHVIQVDQVVHANANHTVGCLTEGTLRELRSQLTNVIPNDGWEKKVASVGCYPVAADIHWRVVDLHGAVVRLQLAEDNLPARPLLYFVVADLVGNQGEELR